MTNGARVIAAAESTLGAHERPDGSNWGDPFIQAAHHRYGLGPNPWCAMAVGEWFARAGVDDARLVHPYTGTICARADAMGGLPPKGAVAPPGSIVIKCGTHVEVLVRDRGDGLLDTIGGNVGNAVRRMVRAKADWRIIVPPSIAADGDMPPAPTTRPSYGFRDLAKRPKLMGGWKTRELRAEKRDAFKAANPGWWTRDVRVDKPSPFAFEAGPPGTFGEPWDFGGWPQEETCDRAMAAYARNHDHERLEKWVKQVPVVTFLGGPSPELSTL